jgi:hypothetical protein
MVDAFQYEVIVLKRGTIWAINHQPQTFLVDTGVPFWKGDFHKITNLNGCFHSGTFSQRLAQSHHSTSPTFRRTCWLPLGFMLVAITRAGLPGFARARVFV